MIHFIKNSFLKYTLFTIIGLILFVSCFASLSYAILKDRSAGTTAANFLKLGVGARASAMTDTTSSTVKDATALYWNPARLGFLERGSVAAMYSSYVDSIKYQTVHIGLPLKGFGTLGTSAHFLTVGDLPFRSQQGQEFTTFSPHDMLLTVGWSKSFRNYFSIGGSGKFIQSKIIETADTFSSDVGIAFQKAPFSFASSVQNIFGSLKFVEDEFSLPFRIRNSLSFFKADFWALSFESDHSKDADDTVGVGSEIKIFSKRHLKIYLRGGYSTKTNDIPGLDGLTSGFGWASSRFNMDYAWVPMGVLDGGQTHRFSLNFWFNVWQLPDTDRDGVPNRRDRCIKTPFGLKVDYYGCAIDTDKDGVIDYLDVCPGTPEGAPIDKFGCPLDTDKDKIPDYKDQCPNTPEKEKVDARGCGIYEKKLDTRGFLATTLYFDTGSMVLIKGYKQKFKTLGEYLRRYPDLRIRIEGHSTAEEQEKYGAFLSEGRAETVRKYLIEKQGMTEDRIVYFGHINSNSSEDNGEKKENRKVDIWVFDP